MEIWDEVLNPQLVKIKIWNLVGVFTRRNPEDVKLLNGNVPVHTMDDIQRFTDEIDVLILCGGSKNDLPEQGPALISFIQHSG